MTPAERFEHRRRRAARKARKRQLRRRKRRQQTLAWLSYDDDARLHTARFKGAEYRFGVTTGRWSSLSPR